MLRLHLSCLVRTLPCFQRVTFVLSESQVNRATFFTQCRFRTQSSDVVKVNVLEHTEYSCMKDKLAAEEERGTIGPLGKVLNSSHKSYIKPTQYKGLQTHTRLWPGSCAEDALPQRSQSHYL